MKITRFLPKPLSINAFVLYVLSGKEFSQNAGHEAWERVSRFIAGIPGRFSKKKPHSPAKAYNCFYVLVEEGGRWLLPPP